MIKKNIVIILGAGASAEASFPTGPDLKEEIATGLRFRFDPFELVSGDQVIYDALCRRFRVENRIDKEMLDKHTTAGNKLSEVISSFVSIDEALHWYSRDPDIVGLGKLAIARFILYAEQSCPLASINKTTGRPELDDLSSSWLPHFLSLAISAARHEDAKGIFRNVTVINFNYDRSFEQYLYLALQAKAGVTPELAKQSLAALKIIRPYGSLGALDWQDDAGLKFGGTRNGDDLFSIAARIRTYTEQIHTQIEGDINAALKNASLVLILGFGFHPQNMALLSKSLSQPDGVQRRVLGSVYKISPENHHGIEIELRNYLGGGPHTTVQLLNKTSAQIFDHLRPTINMAVS